MERRTFIKGAFGLLVVTAGASLGALAGCGSSSGGGQDASSKAAFFTTSAVMSGEAAGPAMEPGIGLVRGENGIAGYFEETHLFNVDDIGAQLIMLADGSRTIDDIAAEAAKAAGAAVDPAEAASFFVTLGQAGFLQNTVLVNLIENPA